jgi:hypothetical protein
MESRGNILLGLKSGGVLFVGGDIGTKIPSEYFAGTGIGTGFRRVGDDRDWGGKTRSRRTLFLTIIQFLTDIEFRPGPGPGPELKKNFHRDRDRDQKIFTGTRPGPGPKKSDFADP